MPRILALMMILTAVAFGVALRKLHAGTVDGALTATFVGVIAGCLYWNRYRGLGIATASFGVVITASVIEAAEHCWLTLLLQFVCLGVGLSRITLFLSRCFSGKKVAVCALLSLIGCGVIRGLGPSREPWIPPVEPFWLPLLTGLLTVLSLVYLFRPTFELLCEPFLWIMYWVLGVGPGIAAMPQRGPCIVVANHSCWFDPVFLSKVLPRPITAMMTSRFYDKPVLHWLFKYVLHPIRVPDHAFRRQGMPEEIREGISALDRGECLVIFPEGALRRSDEQPLRRFGRGVWQILAARPDTPVYACWIEGGWGSYCSYFNGKPTKNKRPDFRRPIGVAVPDPIRLDAATLSDHLTTRIFLMNRVLESRKLLGLPELPPFELPKEAED